MGQQQLMLVVLVVVIVGISTVVTLNILGFGADNANRDAVRADLLSAASYVQEIWERPTLLNGANRDFTRLTEKELLHKLKITGIRSENIISNRNGSYEISIQEITEIKVTGTPSSGGETIEVYVCFDSEAGRWLINSDTPTADKPTECD
jgi:hypothetical protein